MILFTENLRKKRKSQERPIHSLTCKFEKVSKIKYKFKSSI